MNLHILHPEKVSGRTIAMFENAIPDENMYLFVNHNWENYHDSKTMAHQYEDKIVYLDDNGIPEKDIDFSEVNRIFIHYLDIPKIRFIKRSGLESKKICWICWGGDLTNLILHHLGYNMYSRYPGPIIERIKYRLGIRRFYKKSPQLQETLDFIAKHISVMATAFPAEYKLAKKWLKKEMSQVAYAEFFYYPIELILPQSCLNIWCNRKYLFVGHSASFTGNHKYSFKKLRNINLNDRQIIVPINYNGTTWNKKHIKSMGQKYCKNKCIFLESFIPLPEYNNLMLKADRFIFNNWRQEAWGNIQIAIYIGAKIFMSKKSILATHMKELGLHFEYISNLDQDTFDKDLTDSQKLENRRIVSQTYSAAQNKKLCQKLCLF